MSNTLTNVKDIKVAQKALMPFTANLMPVTSFSTNFGPQAAVDRLDPVVTTLGKVGGGGYGSGLLDMQRENNRLTRDTNLIITGLHETVKKLSGGRQAVFA